MHNIVEHTRLRENDTWTLAFPIFAFEQAREGRRKVILSAECTGFLKAAGLLATSLHLVDLAVICFDHHSPSPKREWVLFCEDFTHCLAVALPCQFHLAPEQQQQNYCISFFKKTPF